MPPAGAAGGGAGGLLHAGAVSRSGALNVPLPSLVLLTVTATERLPAVTGLLVASARLGAFGGGRGFGAPFGSASLSLRRGGSFGVLWLAVCVLGSLAGEGARPLMAMGSGTGSYVNACEVGDEGAGSDDGEHSAALSPHSSSTSCGSQMPRLSEELRPNSETRDCPGEWCGFVQRLLTRRSNAPCGKRAILLPCRWMWWRLSSGLMGWSIPWRLRSDPGFARRGGAVGVVDQPSGGWQRLGKRSHRSSRSPRLRLVILGSGTSVVLGDQGRRSERQCVVDGRSKDGALWLLCKNMLGWREGGGGGSVGVSGPSTAYVVGIGGESSRNVTGATFFGQLCISL